MLQFRDPGFGNGHAVLTLELEGFGDNADRQNSGIPRCLGDDRSRTGTGAAAHASGDERHVTALQVVQNFVLGFLGSSTADFGFRPRTQALGGGDPHLHLAFCRR